MKAFSKPGFVLLTRLLLRRPCVCGLAGAHGLLVDTACEETVQQVVMLLLEPIPMVGCSLLLNSYKHLDF
jgi:hypothetical protein